uniref:RING-type domain-containing protein n=1 Tax=Noccaea caerulescens TaxID=107243 RepID=A0A1J3GW42_NOCCA
MLSIPNTKMWNLASSYVTGNVGPKNEARKPVHAHGECSDDDASSVGSKDEGLECPICFESFNIVENVPYVLWCGHTMCKNCILGLQWAIVKLPTHPVQLPLFISCPWCNLLSFRLVFRGTLRFPRKNYFVLWMVERMNGERRNSPGRDQTEGNNDSARESPCLHHRHHRTLLEPSRSDHHHHHRRSNPRDNIQTSLRKSLVFFVQLTAKFPLVVIFLLIILYAIPASAAILAMYILVTLLLALPSFLILYFAYPCLDWLVREIVT